MPKKMLAAIVMGAVLGASVPALGLAGDEAAPRKTDAAPAQDAYEKRLADYEKDRAAYEADPGIWTAEVPVRPANPEAAGTASAPVPERR